MTFSWNSSGNRSFKIRIFSPVLNRYGSLSFYVYHLKFASTVIWKYIHIKSNLESDSLLGMDKLDGRFSIFSLVDDNIVGLMLCSCHKAMYQNFINVTFKCSILIQKCICSSACLYWIVERVKLNGSRVEDFREELGVHK